MRRQVGDFEGRTLVGSFDPTPQTCDHHQQPFGLTVDCTYVYGTFRTADGEALLAVRRVATAGDTVGLTLLRAPAGEEDLRIVGEVGGSTFMGRARPRMDREVMAFVGGKSYPHPKRAFDLRIGADTLTWADGDHVDVTARRVGPGMQFLTPWPSGAVLYLSRLWVAQGRVGGQPVQGFMGVDQFLGPPGDSWGHDPVSEHYELSWYTWGNAYDDGSVEVGHVAAGVGGWGFALFNDDRGGVTRTTDVRTRDVERDSDGWPLRIVYDVEGQAWEWTADARGRMPDLGLPGQRRTPNSEGQLRRLGEDRGITTWFAWGETAPHNGDRHRDAPPVG